MTPKMCQEGVTSLTWVISVGAAIAFLPLTPSSTSALRSVIKTIPLVGFTTIAAYHRLPFALILALAFSAGGDFALSRPGDTAFLIGLISFALGHICYIVLFSPRVQKYAFWSLLVFLGLAISTEFWLAPHTEDMKWPVRAYVIIICIMSFTAVSLPQDTALHLATWGALSFLASDLLLSLVLFRIDEDTRESEVVGYILWTLYILGQALILIAFLQYEKPLETPQSPTTAETAREPLGEDSIPDDMHDVNGMAN